MKKLTETYIALLNAMFNGILRIGDLMSSLAMSRECIRMNLTEMAQLGLVTELSPGRVTRPLISRAEFNDLRRDPINRVANTLFSVVKELIRVKSRWYGDDDFVFSVKKMAQMYSLTKWNVDDILDEMASRGILFRKERMTPDNVIKLCWIVDFDKIPGNYRLKSSDSQQGEKSSEASSTEITTGGSTINIWDLKNPEGRRVKIITHKPYRVKLVRFDEREMVYEVIS